MPAPGSVTPTRGTRGTPARPSGPGAPRTTADLSAADPPRLTPVADLADRAGGYWGEQALVAEEDLSSFLEPLHWLTEEAARHGLHTPQELAGRLTDVLLALSGAAS